MRILALLLFLGIASGSSDNDERVFVGKLLAASHTTIELDRNESIMSIGFVGDADALAGIDALQVGDEVRAVFGSTTPPGESRSINKLLSIRRCERNDEQCAADGRVQDTKDAEAENAGALFTEEVAQCAREMDKTLLNDARYAPEAIEVSDSQSKEYLRQLNALTGNRQECATAVMHDHQKAVLDACEMHHCGDSIGGGCSHIAGYSLSDAAIVRALRICKDK
jgi:hypothetical protein